MERKKRINTPCKLTPVQRTAICLDGEQLCVMLCGSLPTLMAHLLVRDDVRLYAVRTSAELKETLTDADGIPADLVIVEAHTMAGLPQMSFFSPADNHESEVIFSSDPFITDEERFGEIYALIDKMLVEKQQRIEKVWELFERENGDCAGTREKHEKYL